jgi:hypothetical protein
MQAVEMNEFRNQWEFCPGCHQSYQNELRIDIASEFVSFVRRKYPDNTRRQVEALYLKLSALNSMLDRSPPVQKREAGVSANVLLSLIDRMKGDVSPLPMRCSQMESFAYNTHGRIALDEGTEESARMAVVYFHKDLNVNEAIGNADGVAVASRGIALAKSKYESGNNNEELLKASQELYELRIAELGEESEHTICTGNDYALQLVKARRVDEARELLTKLLATSKQVLGHHHDTTKMIESTLQCAKRVELLLKWVNGIYSSKSVFVVCILIGVLAMSYQLVKLSLSLWAVGTINYVMFIV